MYKQELDLDKACLYFSIGLMSGSSLDGLDVAYCTFQKKHINPGKWDHAIIFAETYEYPQEVFQILFKLKNADQLTAFDFCKFDRDLGTWMGQKVKSFIDKHDLRKIDVIASHGHTIFHSPEEGITVQIGHPACIAAITNLPVIGDFRQLDVSLGGQGTPLVPIGDRLLYEKYSFCLNLGGISNITFTNPNDQEKLIAYDVCIWEHSYDNNGDMSSRGEVILDLLEKLNGLEFHSRQPPKSLSNQYLRDVVIPIIEAEEFKNYSIESKLRTCVEMIASQIASVLELTQQKVCQSEKLFNSIYMPKFQKIIVQEDQSEDYSRDGQIAEIISPINSHRTPDLIKMKLLICGGGVYNKCLLNCITEKAQILGIDTEIIDSLTKFKEAMVFAFLGVLRLRKELNVLSSVTGGSQSSSSGCIYHNFRSI